MVDCVRSISFLIPGSLTTPGVKITAIEDETNHTIKFTAEVLATATKAADLRGLFFDLNDNAKLTGLTFSNVVGGNLTQSQVSADSVLNLGGGVNMAGKASPFDVGLKFGAPGAQSTIQKVEFTMSNLDGNLTLDDIAHADFGAVVPGSNGKLFVVAPAAPKADDDAYAIYEDGAIGLSDPRETAQGVKFNVLDGDTDADGDTLTITEVSGALHGTVAIVDGDDADLLPGDAVLYTPNDDYSGDDTFEYCISDGNGGTDHAVVTVTVQAVADEPDVTIEVVDADDAVNQVRLLVTATQTDDDGSEFIDSIVPGSLPDGVTINPASYNPVSVDGVLQQEFLVTLPENQDIDFDLSFTATSVESSNNDTEDNSASIPIVVDFNSNAANKTFVAEDQNMWGDAPSVASTGEFFGIQDEGIHFDEYPWPLHIAVEATVTAGLQPIFTLDGGSIDAELNYDLTIDTTMNRTTDTLKIDTSATLKDGQFTTTGAGGEYGIYLVAGYDVGVLIALDLDADFADVLQWDIVNVDPPLQSVTVPYLTVEDGNDPDFVNINGTTFSAAWPELSVANSNQNLLTGEFTGSGTYEDFVAIDSDLDSILSPLGYAGVGPFDIPFALDVPLVVAAAGFVELLDFDIGMNMDLAQSMKMTAQDLPGIITFENGDTMNITFGDEVTLQNAVATYDAIANGGNGDGHVDFTVEIDANALFANQTNLVKTTDIDYDLLTVKGAYDYYLDSDPAEDFELTAIDLVDETDTTLVGLYDDSFNLDFGTQSMSVIV